MDADVIELIAGFGITALLLAVGFSSGTLLEKSHFRRLRAREAVTSGVLVTQLRTFPGGVSSEAGPRMLVAESVISSDYFKSFLAGIRKLFGGEMRSYISLLERARREAQLRIVEEAAALGYDAVCNVRLETVDLGGVTNPKRQFVAVAILASATAYKRPA